MKKSGILLLPILVTTFSFAQEAGHIIKAIALSSRGIVSGKETPSRVDTRLLK